MQDEEPITLEQSACFGVAPLTSTGHVRVVGSLGGNLPKLGISVPAH